jgi:hypothetical protein
LPEGWIVEEVVEDWAGCLGLELQVKEPYRRAEYMESLGHTVSSAFDEFEYFSW